MPGKIEKVFVTGASRGIGAETARMLADEWQWDVAIGAREKITRAEKVAADIKAAGREAVIIPGDITVEAQRQKVIERVSAWAPQLGGLVLNAAGGLEQGKDESYAMNVNRDSQVALVRGLKPVLRDGVVVYVTSHWSHLYGEVSMPPFDYEAVASTKKAGEMALRAMEEELSEEGIRLAVVTAGVVEGTTVSTTAGRRFPEYMEEQRAIDNIVSIQRTAEAIADSVVDVTLPTGHTKVVGASMDVMRAKYGLQN
jgi:NAD(P)-dependent dehydrogenase (short-subunit alcohol dehydrogenase family)